jgi:hypothetical protein
MRPTSLATVGLAWLVTVGTQALSPTPATAAEDPYGGMEVLRGLFASNDFNRDGRISLRELQVFANLAFVSMDTDSDDRVTLEEFMLWDPGFESLARERGKVEALEAAKREVFKTRDRDRDDSVDETELLVSCAYDFIEADKDQNGSLNPGEFAFDYPILGTIATALR